MRRALAATAIVVLAACALDACTRATAAPSTRTVDITIHHSAFDPAEVHVRPGETIRFVIRNTDPIDHEFIVGDRAVQDAHERGTEAYHPARPGEVTVPAGQTVRTTFTFGGDDLLFGCHIPGHWAYGMRGIVLVG
ncbi:MAG: cupredoxin domain-containing protein [Actinobacteria bacterium]|nr:cupredoxin domain-containing protein [Actinomycetota bacterium]